jgi:hypothetical protein
MTVYLNKTRRPDILVETGGSLDENEAHVTSSTLRIYMPADSKDIAACDYIQLVENDMVIFAGTIMEAEQENLDNVDLSYKIYNLTLTNNSDYIASVFGVLMNPAKSKSDIPICGRSSSISWEINPQWVLPLVPSLNLKVLGFNPIMSFSACSGSISAIVFFSFRSEVFIEPVLA